MYRWINKETGEILTNELDYITVGGDCLGETTYAYLGESNVILFSMSGDLTVDEMEKVFTEMDVWTIVKDNEC